MTQPSPPPAPEPTPLARILRERIQASGPIPFHDFMEAALYDPEHGYYSRGPRIGGEGADFSTSVSFPSFRAAIGRLVRRAHAALGAPDAFRVVELGAGTGALARAVTEDWRAHHPGTPLDYVTVERSPVLRARQAAVPGVRGVARAADLEPAPCLVFGNEVLDALPVRRVMGGPEGALLEIFVDWDARTGRFRERLLPPADEAGLRAGLARVGVAPQRGQIVEVAPALDAFVREAARLPDPGFLVFVDYGDPAPALYAPSRINGTLAVYKAGGRFHEWGEGVGERDLTADVDFTTVALAARDAGMEEVAFTSQEEFLHALGIDELGLPDEVRMVAGAAGLGSAFHVAVFGRGAPAPLEGF